MSKFEKILRNALFCVGLVCLPFVVSLVSNNKVPHMHVFSACLTEPSAVARVFDSVAFVFGWIGLLILCLVPIAIACAFMYVSICFAVAVGRWATRTARTSRSIPTIAESFEFIVSTRNITGLSKYQVLRDKILAATVRRLDRPVSLAGTAAALVFVSVSLSVYFVAAPRVCFVKVSDPASSSIPNEPMFLLIVAAIGLAAAAAAAGGVGLVLSGSRGTAFRASVYSRIRGFNTLHTLRELDQLHNDRCAPDTYLFQTCVHELGRLLVVASHNDIWMTCAVLHKQTLVIYYTDQPHPKPKTEGDAAVINMYGRTSCAVHGGSDVDIDVVFNLLQEAHGNRRRMPDGSAPSETEMARFHGKVVVL